MKPTIRRTCLALALLATAGLAAFAVAQTATAPTSRPEVQFKVVDSPFEVSTYPGDPALWNNKYVAVFRYGKPITKWDQASAGQPMGPRPAGFGSPGAGPTGYPAPPPSPYMSSGRGPVPAGSVMVMPMGPAGPVMGMSMGGPSYPGIPTGIPVGLAPRDESWLQNALANTSREFPLSDRLRALLSTQGPGVVRIHWAPVATDRKGSAPQTITMPDGMQYVGTEMVPEFQVLAPTPEQAEELAKALITACVHGDPERIQLQQAIKTLQARFDDAQEKFTKAKARLVELDAKLQPIEDVDPEAMKELKKQRWLLTVQVTGAKARMDAAKSQVTASPNPADQAKNRQLEEITIATSIELAGLLASQNRIEKLISQGGERQELTTQRDAVKAEADTSEQGMRMPPMPGMPSAGWKSRPLIPDYIKELQADLAELDLMASQIGVVNIYPIKPPAPSPAPTPGTPVFGPGGRPMPHTMMPNVPGGMVPAAPSGAMGPVPMPTTTTPPASPVTLPATPRAGSVAPTAPRAPAR